MINEDFLTDDYVGAVLAKDAKESSIKYSALGVEAFMTSKPPANKPKPNTRFLRNIIKETDSHNVALLAREAAESRARFKNLSDSGQQKDKSSRGGVGDIRKRQLGDIAAILGGSSTKPRGSRHSPKPRHESRLTNDIKDDEKLRKKDRGESVRHKNEHDGDDQNERSRSRRKHRRRHESPLEDQGKTKDSHKRRHRSRSRSRSSSPKRHRSTKSRHRHRSPKRRRSKSPVLEADKGKLPQAHHKRHSPSSRNGYTKRSYEEPIGEQELKSDNDSDPLDELIGPCLPPVAQVKSRGRGTTSLASGIDARFSSTYDPSADVQLDPEDEDDWGLALEALRDRQKWKQRGADRLRAAGFTDDEIRKWEKGDEKREEDVKWAKQGEDRDWDLGKVVYDDGTVTVESSWGRLNAA